MARKIIKPQPGPQTEVAKSPADEILYGGAAGGGKSFALLIEAARYVHAPGYRAIILRRKIPEIMNPGGLSDESYNVYPLLGGEFKQTRMRWSFPSGATISFGHMEKERDRFMYQSAQFAFIGFDQVEDFTYLQYTYMLSRMRSMAVDPRTDKNISSRLLACANPPAPGQPGIEWLAQRFRPWLVETYSYPAQPGELRWFLHVAGKDKEVRAGTPHALSRTFVPARIYDNKILLEKDPHYLWRLQALPEPFRSMYLEGIWSAGSVDADRVITLASIKAAQARWKPNGFVDKKLTAIACDVARGGNKTVIGKKFEDWIAPLEEHSTKDTMEVVGLLRKARGKETHVPMVVDVVGVGAGVVDRLKELGEPNIVAFNGANSSKKTDASGLLGFRNLRAEAHWHSREVLSSEDAAIALPQDTELLAELASSTWKMFSTGIQIEEKSRIERRLGRSPDKGDTVVMLMWSGSWMPPAMSVGESSAQEDMARRRRSGWWPG